MVARKGKTGQYGRPVSPLVSSNASCSAYRPTTPGELPSPPSSRGTAGSIRSVQLARLLADMYAVADATVALAAEIRSRYDDLRDT
jgi:hypothetical protein